MKKTLPAFLAGVIATLVVLGSAYAITTNMTIEVWPINILINGETFQPHDVNGTEVPVFVYNGTTYAPLRALAEAYGLVVGYDGEKNQATVSSPEYIAEQERLAILNKEYETWDTAKEADYQAFKSLWNLSKISGGNSKTVNAKFCGKSVTELTDIVYKYSDIEVKNFCTRLLDEVYDSASMDEYVGGSLQEITYYIGDSYIWGDSNYYINGYFHSPDRNYTKTRIEEYTGN